VAGLAATLAWQDKGEVAVGSGEAFSISSRVFVFAHRGARASAPENTLAAFDRAFDLGAHGLEMDVRLARDGIPVVHHDERLERTTSGHGLVADYTSRELAAVDAGFRFAAADGFPFRGRGLAVPSLREVLDRYPGVPLIIEMKGNDSRLPGRTIDELRSARALDRVCLGGFSRAMLARARRLAPDLPTSACRWEMRMLLFRSRLGWPIGSPRFRVCQPPYRFRGRRVLSPNLVRLLHRAGIPVQPWTVNDPADVREVVGWGVDGLITDEPDVAVRVVAAGSR
jgi:glycerophosphoryl diester phosphodiesterase